MTTKLVLISILLVLLLGGVYFYTNPQVESEPIQRNDKAIMPQVDSPKNIESEPPSLFTGILRPSGLLQEQKQKMHLYPGDNIVVTKPFAINGKTYNFAYLGQMISNSSFPVEAYANGKCVRVEGIIDPLSVNDAQTYYGESTFGGVALTEGTMQPVGIEECRDVIAQKSKPIGEEFESYEINGVLSSINRPAPDIEYDYIIGSPFAIKGVVDMSGLYEEKDSVVVVPANFDVYKGMEENLGKQVTVRGYLQWGYAESQFFTVEEVL